MNTIPYLHLDCIKIDHDLKRLLPQEVAYRYCALPVAQDGNRITVAMAYPDDRNASAAVISAIGGPICLVQADPQEIEKRLAELWPQNPESRLRLLLWSSTTATAVSLDSYAQSLTKLLDADLIQINIPWRGVKSINELSCVAEQIRPDLIIFQLHNPAHLKRMLLDSIIQKQIDRLPASVIIPQNPRWPLAKILLTIPDCDSEEESAIRWAVQLARSGQTAVTVLPLLPSVPGWYGSFIQHSLQALLEAEDPMGLKMRSISKRFSEDEINGTFKLREGEPLNQLRYELLTSDPDLVIIPSSPHNTLRRWMTGDLVNPLLAWADRPILISKEYTFNS